jgi:fructoselysine-6-P-deglycase FrlB-like protein
MIDDDRSQTAMAREIREIPTTAERLLAERDSIITVANRIRQADPRVVVISGRGSSANAGTLPFATYLKLGSAAPSGRDAKLGNFRCPQLGSITAR